MLAQRQPVDDRDVGLRGQLEGDLVRPGPDHDAVDEAVEVARHVADALAGPEHDVMGEVDRVTAELGHPGLERHARAQARLLEEHGQRPTRQRRQRVAPRRPELRLQPRRRLEDPPDLSRRQVGHAQQIPPAQRCSGRHRRSNVSFVVKRSGVVD